MRSVISSLRETSVANTYIYHPSARNVHGETTHCIKLLLKSELNYYNGKQLTLGILEVHFRKNTLCFVDKLKSNYFTVGTNISLSLSFRFLLRPRTCSVPLDDFSINPLTSTHTYVGICDMVYKSPARKCQTDVTVRNNQEQDGSCHEHSDGKQMH